MEFAIGFIAGALVVGINAYFLGRYDGKWRFFKNIQNHRGDVISALREKF